MGIKDEVARQLMKEHSDELGMKKQQANKPPAV
jgi:hypothetical protein